MEKREWVYVQNPKAYEMSCDKCNGNNIEWSEYEGMIWCYDCEIDTRGNGGVFDGPIAIGAATLLGLSFDRIRLKDMQLMKLISPSDKIHGGALIWKLQSVIEIEKQPYY